MAARARLRTMLILSAAGALILVLSSLLTGHRADLYLHRHVFRPAPPRWWPQDACAWAGLAAGLVTAVTWIDR